MLLLPLQPLSGDSVVEPSVSAGAFGSGNGFQGVLQEAQHQLAMASSDPPDESAPPSLASLVSEALTDALTPEEGSAKGQQTPVITQGKTPSPMLAASDDVIAEVPEAHLPVGEVSDDASENTILKQSQESDVELEGQLTKGKQLPLSQNLSGKTIPQHPVTMQVQQDHVEPEQNIVSQSIQPSAEPEVKQQISQPDFESMPEPQRQHIPTPHTLPKESGSLEPEGFEVQRPVSDASAASQPQEQVVDQNRELPIAQYTRQAVMQSEVHRRAMPMQRANDQDVTVQDQGVGNVEAVQPGTQVETLSAPWPVQYNQTVIQTEARVVSDLNTQDDRVQDDILETDNAVLPVVDREAPVVNGEMPQANRETPIVNRPEVVGRSGVVDGQPQMSDSSVEGGSALPLVNRETPVVNRETPIVNRPEVVGRSDVVDGQPQMSDSSVEEGSELPLVNRETPVLNREAPVVDDEMPQANREALVLNREAPVVNGEMPQANRETPIVNRPEVVGSSDVVDGQPQMSDSSVEEGSALPLVNRETPVVNRETPTVNREAPIVNRPEVVGSSGVVVGQPQMSDSSIEEGSALPLVNRETPVVNRETPTVNREAPIVNRPEVVGSSGVVVGQPQMSDSSIEEGSALPLVNRETPVVNRETPTVNREAPIVNRPEVVGSSDVVRDQGLVGGRVVGQNSSVVSGTDQHDTPLQPVFRGAVESQTPAPGVAPQDMNRRPHNLAPSDNQPTLREIPSVQSQQNVASMSQSESQVVRQDAPPVTTGAAPALVAEADRPRLQTVAAPVDSEVQSVEGAEYKISSSSTSSQEQAFTANDENASQRPVISRAPVERTGNQPSFVIPDAEVVQMPEQPAQVSDGQSPELDVELGAGERPASRIDVTSGSSRSSQDATPRVDLEASAEEIDRIHRVSQQIIRSARVMNRDGATQVTMRLDPPELGEVSIQISSSQSGVVSGEIAVESQKVQEIVQRNMGALREALSEQGIQIDQIDVSVDDRGGSNTADRESFREALEERSNNANPNADQQQPQSQEEIEQEETSSQASSADGGVNFVA